VAVSERTTIGSYIKNANFVVEHIKLAIKVDFNLRNDLMSKAFPSIWIEVLDKFK
jgi:subtilisin-like proprotein convertase family protein